MAVDARDEQSSILLGRGCGGGGERLTAGVESDVEGVHGAVEHVAYALREARMRCDGEEAVSGGVFVC